MTELSRRRFGRLVAGGAAAAAVGALARPDSAAAEAPGYITRLNGVILTNATMPELSECIRRGDYNAKKVISGWGPRTGGWTTDLINQVVNVIPGKTIVRTVTGDGQYGNQGYTGPSSLGNPLVYPMPDRVEAEFAPWYALRQDAYIEIGNEPNTSTWAREFVHPDPARRQAATDFVWNYQYWFDQCVTRVRAKFPRAKIISPGLAFNYDQGINFHPWYQICQGAFSKANFIGFHQFGAWSFRENWSQAVVPELNRWYAGKDWFCTEYGLSNWWANCVPTEDETARQRLKGRQYAELVHFNGSDAVWPHNVKGAVYYHLDTRDPCNGNPIEPRYAIYASNGDYGYRHRKQVG